MNAHLKSVTLRIFILLTLFTVFALLLNLSHFVFAQTTSQTLGNTTIGSVVDTSDSNSLDGTRFTMPSASGTSQSMSVYVGNIDSSPNNQYQMAIYNDNNGTPGTLVAQTASGTLTANSWNTLPISAALQANTNYWLMYNTNGTNGEVNNAYYTNVPNNNGAFSDVNVTFSSWPQTFPTAALGGWEFSIYVTYK